MYPCDLLVKIVRETDPIPFIAEYLSSKIDPIIDLNEIAGSYGRIEEVLQSFEEWLHKAWGIDFYKCLASTDFGWAIPKALKKASEINANVLVCDGFSIRELFVLQKKMGNTLNYSLERTPAPTTTENVSAKVFGSPNLKDAFRGETFHDGYKWHSDFIADITNPPRIGNQRGHLFLTQYLDASLHGARSHKTTQVQEISNIVKQLIALIESLSKNAPLIVTGDHGYIYLGANPARYLWGSAPKKQERFGGEYGDNCLEIDGQKVAVGRIHVNVGPGTNTFIAHGGVSLTESLVPVVTIEASGTN